MSTPVWLADIAVDVPLVRQLLTAQFPALATETVEPFGAGWDNVAYLVGTRVLFRFPRRRICANLIDREIAVLPGVASEVSLAISAPAYIGKPSAEYPWSFAGYPLIAGTAASAIALTDDDRTALAVPLATFLRELHAIDPEPLVACGLPPDEMKRLDPEKALRLTRERLPTLIGAAIVDQPERLFSWLERHPPIPGALSERRVVHGDLYAGHVIIGADAALAGVIDWGDMHLGDPALDIAIAHLVLPQRAHDAFRSAYGAMDERTWEAARYRAVYHAILECDYGVRGNEPLMLEIGTTALRFMKPFLV